MIAVCTKTLYIEKMQYEGNEIELESIILEKDCKIEAGSKMKFFLSLFRFIPLNVLTSSTLA